MCFKQRKDCLQVKSPIWVPALTECCQSQRSIQLAFVLIPTSYPKRYVQVTMTRIPVFGWSRKICSTCNDTNSNILSSKRYLQPSVVWVPACTKVKDVLTHVSAPMPHCHSHPLLHLCVALSHQLLLTNFNSDQCKFVLKSCLFRAALQLHQRRCLCMAFATMPRRHQEGQDRHHFWHQQQ